MENIIRFVINHRTLVAVSSVLIILLAWFISFFIANSLMLITIKSDVVSGTEAISIKIDDKTVSTTTIGSQVLLTIPRSSTYISAQSSENSVLTSLDVPAFFGQLELNLKPSNTVAIGDTSGNNCYQRNQSNTVSWQCGELEFDVRKTSYSNDSYPLQSSIDTDDQYLEYAERYKDGFIAISNLDGIGIHYVDLSSANINKTSLNLNEDYVYETVEVVVDKQNSNNFIIFDKSSLSYQFYQDSVSTPTKSGRLPSQFKSEANISNTFSLESGKLTFYSGQSTDNIDNHSSDSNKHSIEGRVVSYDIQTSKLSSTHKLGKIICQDVAVSSDSLACIDRSQVDIYRLNNLSTPILSLSNGYSVFSHRDSLYVAQDSSIYKYDSSENTLDSIFKISNRNIASSYIRNGTLYVSAWYTTPDGRQDTIAYEVDLTSFSKNSNIIKNFPLNISQDIAYGSDIRGDTIYIMLIDDNSEHRNQVRNLLDKKGLSKDYRLVFN